MMNLCIQGRTPIPLDGETFSHLDAIRQLVTAVEQRLPMPAAPPQD